MENTIEKDLKERFGEIDQRAEYNQLKVLHAMQKNHVSADCFNYVSGYGYDDHGRDTLGENLRRCLPYRKCTGSPTDYLWNTCAGTFSCANLRPETSFWRLGGKPYDTLEEVIGIRPSKGSLAEYGISYRQVDLLEDGTFDFDSIREAINEKTKMVTVQRSKGYQTRPSFSVAQIGEVIRFVKEIKPGVICMVDNCYGEFVEEIEPSDVGADMVVGSLIKNPGGGLGADRAAILPVKKN